LRNFSIFKYAIVTFAVGFRLAVDLPFSLGLGQCGRDLELWPVKVKPPLSAMTAARISTNGKVNARSAALGTP
jgi:hypothetical protein